MIKDNWNFPLLFSPIETSLCTKNMHAFNIIRIGAKPLNISTYLVGDCCSLVGFVMAGPSFIASHSGNKIHVLYKVDSKILIHVIKKFHTFNTKIQFALRVGKEECQG